VHLHKIDAHHLHEPIFESGIVSDEMLCWMIIDCDRLVPSGFYGYTFSFGLLFCNIKVFSTNIAGFKYEIQWNCLNHHRDRTPRLS
jgi:hypothetical protein